MVGAFFGALFEQVDVAVFQGVGFGGHLPHDGFEQGGFAHAVAADDAGAGFFGRGEADVVQNVALAVGLVEVFDGEHFASFLGRLNRFQTASGCGGGVGVWFLQSFQLDVGRILESDACSQNKYQAGGGCRTQVSGLHGFQTALRVFVLGFQPNLRLLVRRTIFSGSLGFVGYKYPTYAVCCADGL